jgi:hypothetical protein
MGGAMALEQRSGGGPDKAWADTTTSHGRLMLTVLGGLADDAERVIMRSRALYSDRTAA